ncbi:MAG: alpha-hydroxy-acid oxidizing protein [Zunongwangia sp.]|uniref:alpha-hydroxy-acid oxidizing protein n=1 Tax=Zunongwangia sp. TaxID=1965325 RepID=UPI0032427030
MAKTITSVAAAHRITQKKLPKAIYSALYAGMEKGLTRDNNVLAFDELGVIPRVADLGNEHDQKTRVMGVDLSFPVITSCVGAQGICSEGEKLVAKATKNQER